MDAAYDARTRATRPDLCPVFIAPPLFEFDEDDEGEEYED